MTITLNGKPHTDLDRPISVAELLVQLDLAWERSTPD